MENSIKYYSFLVGHPSSKRTEWILLDKKMPATCVREAIILDSFSTSFFIFEASKAVSRKKMIYTAPSQAYVWLRYRYIIEYERLYTPVRGYTVHQYKKVHMHSIHSILNLFK